MGVAGRDGDSGMQKEVTGQGPTGSKCHTLSSRSLQARPHSKQFPDTLVTHTLVTLQDQGRHPGPHFPSY